MTGPVPLTLAGALALARKLGVERIEAQWLLEQVLARPRSWLAAHPDAPLEPARFAAVDALLRRRADAEPIGYLLGEQAFHGIRLQVDRRVLVPRSDTEVLVDWALACLGESTAEHPRVVDLGTGSGAIALAVRSAARHADVLATDLSDAALAVARANADRLRLPVEFRQGAWWDAAADRRFDLALANPPYIAAGDPHLPALRHEPTLALVSGADGLDALRTIVAGAPAHLVSGGRLLLEHGFDQARAVAALLDRAGFVGVETRRDAAGRDRCTGGRWPG